ncbi:MAG: hypothetical protein AAF723_01170 [Pseudomonadota bacterium]
MEQELLDQAERLIKWEGVDQIDFRRAVSNIYYSLFHALSKNTADCFIGKPNIDRCERAWIQTYRALSHTAAKTACEKSYNPNLDYNFPDEIKRFARFFTNQQEARHRADYNPAAKFQFKEVQGMIEGARKAIETFERAPEKHRRAFSALVVFQERTKGLLPKA